MVGRNRQMELLSKCEILYSEDMQDGMIIDDRLVIQNPFLGY